MKSLIAKAIAISSPLVLALSLILGLGVAQAATLTSASMTLSDSRPSQSSSYTFNASGFTTGTPIKCIKFQFNDAADMSGSVPAGFTSTSASLSSSSLVTAGNWTADASANGTVKLTYTTGEAPASSGNVVLGSITNGSSAGTAYFVAVNTYANTNCSSSPSDAATVGIIYTAGQSVSATVNPTLAFTVGAVNSGQTVNGATTNITTTSGTIPFATTATIGTNAIAAQSLTVSTNSGNGYTAYVKYTGALTNGGHDIDDFSGTHGSPTTFSSAGTENFGYTTDNANLSQFSSNKWSGLTTTSTDNSVASNTSAISNDVTKVGFQLGIGSTTPTGSYSTTVVYTATPIY
ncbi:MAG TPA: hypothetical protein VFW77_01350 [Candidatus Saccharimonadales bacterium]|nr:hypothetical protein [Candidatus Saccharimonadales bacterium]